MALLRRLTILQRLILMLVLAAIGTLIFASFSIWEQRSNLIKQQKLQTVSQIETMASILNQLADTEPEQARALAIKLVQHSHYGSRGGFILLDNKGKVLADSHKQGLQGASLPQLAESDDLTQLVHDAKYQAVAQRSYFHQDILYTAACAYIPKWQWSVITDSNITEINAAMLDLSEDYLILMTLIATPIFLFFLMLNASINRPLKAAIQAMDNIASGDGDLTKRLDTQGRDEVAALSHAFNQFTGKIAHTIQLMHPMGSALEDEGKRLLTAVGEANASASHVHKETASVATAIHQMLTTTHEMAGNTTKAADAALGVKDGASSSQQMMQSTLQQIRELAGELDCARDVTLSLEHASSKIGDILAVIRSISDQTNLLALNAAIEAARAGEHGRGFAVVADEVRALANRTQASTDEIQQIISSIQQGVADVLNSNTTTREQSEALKTSANQVADAMDHILSLINHINDMNTQLASATEEQSLVTEEINRNITTISELTEVAVKANESNAAAADALHNISDDIRQSLDHFKV